jgi:hypothetical protein
MSIRATLKGQNRITIATAARVLSPTSFSVDATLVRPELQGGTFSGGTFADSPSFPQFKGIYGSPTFKIRTEIGLGNVTNESKATMFSNPTFTGTTKVENSSSVLFEVEALGAGGNATIEIDSGGDGGSSFLKLLPHPEGSSNIHFGTSTTTNPTIIYDADNDIFTIKGNGNEFNLNATGQKIHQVYPALT